MKSQLVEMSMQKDKAMNLIPGEMKSFLTDGEDVLLTNPDSGKVLQLIKPYNYLTISAISVGTLAQLYVCPELQHPLPL